MLQFSKTGFCLLFLCLTAGCLYTRKPAAGLSVENNHSKPPVAGSRIAWDYSSLRKVSSDKTGARYNGYGRLIQLHDQSLICVYEADGNVVTVTSTDLGETWSGPVTVAAKPAGFNLAVPDILELQDKSLLVCYNPRPHVIGPSRRFGIRTKKSYDGGRTWKDERLLYQAGYQFENGCWEPAAIQLPDGEIQLFFANEGPYTRSAEQNISLLRSSDKGLTWTTEPETVSFRAGKRDGMPVPLLLQKNNAMVVAIEDNGTVNFKPYILRSSLANNWSYTIDAQSADRSYALAEKISDDIYAGAPYIRQLKTGETMLSYQGTEGRPNKLSASEMKVVIGNEEARNFNRKTAPFAIPENKSGLWNSLSVLADNTVIALTSTNAYSADGSREVWMIKGHVIPELAAAEKTIAVDGAQQEAVWTEPFPVFVGHKGLTQVRSRIVYDDRYLYVLHRVQDAKVFSDSQNPEDHDGVSVQVDATNKSYEKPAKGVFTFFLSAANKLLVKTGRNGQWLALPKTAGTRSASRLTESGYVQELAIPWSLLGGKPARNSRIGLNICLTENTGKEPRDYQESIPANSADQPFSWMTLVLK